MIRILWIPVVGTIAAAIAVAVAHAPRGDTPVPAPVPRTTPDEFRPPEPDTPFDESMEPDEPDTEPAAPARGQYILRLRVDGSFVDDEDGTEYADVAAVLAKLAPPDAPRVTVIVMNDSDDVPEAALDAVREQVQTRVDFRKDYRAPEKEPEEDDEDKEEDGEER